MDLPFELNKEIVDFLTSLPNINDSNGQQTLIHRAALDEQLQRQIKFPGSAVQFFDLLVPVLVRYGQLEDGRDALEAVLESAKDFVGLDRKKDCDVLIQELHKWCDEQTQEPPSPKGPKDDSSTPDSSQESSESKRPSIPESPKDISQLSEKDPDTKRSPAPESSEGISPTPKPSPKEPGNGKKPDNKPQIVVAIIGAVAVIVAAVIGVSPDIIKRFLIKPTPTPTATSTQSPISTSTTTPTPTVTQPPILTATSTSVPPMPTFTPTATPLATPTSYPTPTPTLIPTSTPSPILTAIPNEEFRIKEVVIADAESKRIEPINDIYSVKLGETITITVNFTNPYNYEIGVIWTTRHGDVPPAVDETTNTYTARKSRVDHVIIKVRDKETGKSLAPIPLTIAVVP